MVRSVENRSFTHYIIVYLNAVFTPCINIGFMLAPMPIPARSSKLRSAYMHEKMLVCRPHFTFKIQEEKNIKVTVLHPESIIIRYFCYMLHMPLFSNLYGRTEISIYYKVTQC